MCMSPPCKNIGVKPSYIKASLTNERAVDQREQVEAMGYEAFAALLAHHQIQLGISTRFDLGPFGLRQEMDFVREFGGRLLVTGSAGPKDLRCGALISKALFQ